MRTVTLCEAFQESAARVPERIALRVPGDAVQLTWADYALAVERAAGALAALGVSRGDRVAFLSRNKPELAIAEVAALHLGAVGVVLYTASPPATIEHVLHDSEPIALLVESSLRARLADVEHAVEHVLSLDEAVGEQAPLSASTAPISFDFEAAWRAVCPDELAGIVYTSGTTGPAKGVEISHHMATSWIDSFDQVWPEPDGTHDISYGSFANVGERGCGHWRAMVKGSTRTFCEDPKQLPVALLDARPTFLFGPPQVWQALKRALLGSLDANEQETLRASARRAETILNGETVDSLSSEQEETLARLRARVGLERINKTLCAAAPCPPALRAHYLALGLPFGENFAMTEVGSATAQRPGLLDFGTLGPAAPGYELRIAEDGELLIRSPHTASSYRNRPRESTETFATDGWVHTGDLGELDGEGRLRLLGRKKEIIISAHGHNVAPARLESALQDECPLILHVCAIGEGRPHVAAIIAIDPTREHDDAVDEAVVAAIELVNAELDPRERIEAHTIVADPWLPGAELTETFKLRRGYINERYASAVERMYGSPIQKDF
jgi:long-chain acyl-CoA synthetase